MKHFVFQLRVSNSKVKEYKLNLRVSNSKFDLIFYEVESVTGKKNFVKNFRVSNSMCDVILRNSRIPNLTKILLLYWTRLLRTQSSLAYEDHEMLLGIHSARESLVKWLVLPVCRKKTPKVGKVLVKLFLFSISNLESLFRILYRHKSIYFFNLDLNRGCLVYMFSLGFSGSTFLTNLRQQFLLRKFFSCM